MDQTTIIITFFCLSLWGPNYCTFCLSVCFLLNIQCLGSTLTVSNKVCLSHLFRCESFLIYFIHLSIFTNISEPSGECAGPEDKYTAVFGDIKLLSGVTVAWWHLPLTPSLQGWTYCELVRGFLLFPPTFDILPTRDVRPPVFLWMLHQAILGPRGLTNCSSSIIDQHYHGIIFYGINYKALPS